MVVVVVVVGEGKREVVDVVCVGVVGADLVPPRELLLLLLLLLL